MGMNLKKLQEEFTNIYKCVSDLTVSCKDSKKAICYLGLILFKVVVYVNRFSLRSEDSGYYFKDDLSFAVRHSNVVLYKRLKELMDVSNIFKLPLDSLYERSKAAVTKVIHPTHPNFGNPKVSLRSYFDYLDRGTDWFEDKKIAQLVASFDFKDDTLIIEHREFGPTIAT